MKTLYISDLDGTLLQPDITLSKNTITTLNSLMEQGMNFSVATARSIASIKHILKDVQISLPVVLMNGVCIYDLNKTEYLHIEFLPKPSVDALLDLIKTNHLKGFVYTIKDGAMSTYYEDLSYKALKDFYQERVDLYQKKFTQIDDFSLLREEPIIYFSLMDREEALQPTYERLKLIPDLNCTFYKDNYSPDFWYLEVFSKNASKYHAVKRLREMLGYEHVVCFGDNRNDLPMFEASDTRIAVGNAVPELKEKADYIVGNNTCEGVATWLAENFK
ncbi:MAG: hypothetical protein K0R00_621 [Herbinix sp.]|jgi:Cof subfamily protein (haloacid dehalogenase superfamily)|nr:hypothetical protein [Herbinix sp.]